MPWPTKKLGEICDLYQPKTITLKEIKPRGLYKVFGANGVIGFYDKYNHEESEVLITCRGSTCGNVNISEPMSWVTGNSMVIHPKNICTLSKKFLFWILKSLNLSKKISGTAQPQITRSSLYSISIPLPPLSVQKQIVEKIEKLFSKIDETEKLLEESFDASSNLFNSALQKVFNREEKEGWEIRKLGELLDYEQPTKYLINSPDYSDKYNTPVLTAGKTFVLGKTNEKDGIFPKEKLPVIIFDDFTTASKFVDFSFKVKSSAMKILHAKKDLVDVKFIFYKMQTINFPVVQHKRYWISEYSKIEIFLPPLSEQKKIVEYLDGLRKKVEELKRLQEEQLKSLEELRKSILKKAFEGNINSF